MREGYCICGHALVQHASNADECLYVACNCLSYTPQPSQSQPQPGDKVVNEKGGSQSFIPVAFDLILPDWLTEMAEVLYEGAVRHGRENWKNISMDDHLNHAMAHIQQYRMGDKSERHLINICCRMMFAYYCDKEETREGTTTSNTASTASTATTK